MAKNEFLEKIKSDNLKAQAFIKQAKESGAKITKEKAVTIADAGSKAELNNPQALEALAASQKGLVAEVFTDNSQAENHIFFISKISLPTEEAIQAVKETEVDRYNQESSAMLYQTLVDTLKSRAEIEIANNLRNSL